MTKRILIVDDEALIALMIAKIIRGANFEVVGPAATVRQALELISREQCDGAILDIKLKYATSEPIAQELTARGIPILIVSGFSADQFPPAFAGMPAVLKPFAIPDLLERLRGLFQA